MHLDSIQGYAQREMRDVILSYSPNHFFYTFSIETKKKTINTSKPY